MEGQGKRVKPAEVVNLERAVRAVKRSDTKNRTIQKGIQTEVKQLKTTLNDLRQTEAVLKADKAELERVQNEFIELNAALLEEQKTLKQNYSQVENELRELRSAEAGLDAYKQDVKAALAQLQQLNRDMLSVSDGYINLIFEDVEDEEEKKKNVYVAYISELFKEIDQPDLNFDNLSVEEMKEKVRGLEDLLSNFDIDTNEFTKKFRLLFGFEEPKPEERQAPEFEEQQGSEKRRVIEKEQGP